MSFKIYPVTQSDDICCDYEVKINGVIAELDTARVSAVPFNRRWPGHQRQKNQTELTNFVSYEADESVSFEIKPVKPFEDVVIRPLSLGIKPQISEDGIIRFSLDKSAYFTVEPYGLHNPLHVFGNEPSDYDVDFNDDNVIYYGCGKHEVGIIELKSNQTLFIDEGAVVYARVFAKDAENIKILGRGILDNSHNKAEILFEAKEDNNKKMLRNAKRTHTVLMDYCENIEIEGITIRDSLLYNIKCSACENIQISNVKLIGNWRYNSDGMNTLNCRNVLIKNCFLRTFDDGICVKGFDFYTSDDVDKAVYEASHHNGKVFENASDIHIRNCVLWCDYSNAFSIGAETKAEEMYNILYEDCDIIHFNCGALDVHNIDYAHVHDVTFKNINVEYDDVVPMPRNQTADEIEYENTDPYWTPYLINVRTTYHHEYSAGGNRRGKTDNIKFENIRIYGKHRPKAQMFGYDEEHKSKDVFIENLYWNDRLVTDWDEFILETKDYIENICLNGNQLEI